MKRTEDRHSLSIRPVLRATRSLALTASLICLCLGIAPSLAKADIFTINAVLGNRLGNNGPGPDTSKSLTGTLTIDPTTGILSDGQLIVDGDPNLFHNFFGCPIVCTFTYTDGFSEFGFLGLLQPGQTDLVGYQGGSLQPGSYIDVSTVAYDLTGSIDPERTPEPGFYGALLLGMSGLLFAVQRRRRA